MLGNLAQRLDGIYSKGRTLNVNTICAESGPQAKDPVRIQ